MTDHPRQRPRPTRPRSTGSGRTIVVDLLPPVECGPPPKPKTPLFFFGRRDEMTLNWRHWAAPLMVLLAIILLPISQSIRFMEFARSRWHRYVYWAEQRRKNRSPKP